MSEAYIVCLTVRIFPLSHLSLSRLSLSLPLSRSSLSPFFLSSLSRYFLSPLAIMDRGVDIPGGDQPLRVEVSSLSVPPESDTAIGDVLKTPGVLVSAAMAKEAMA